MFAKKGIDVTNNGCKQTIKIFNAKYICAHLVSRHKCQSMTQKWGTQCRKPTHPTYRSARLYNNNIRVYTSFLFLLHLFFLAKIFALVQVQDTRYTPYKNRNMIIVNAK